MNDYLPRLTSTQRRRVLLRAGGVTLLCIAMSLGVTYAFYTGLNVEATLPGYGVAALIPAVCGMSICSWLFLRIEQVKIAYRQLDLIASTDWLTGCLNRRAFTTAATRHQPNDTIAALLVLDIDHFKLVNDRFGHECGDDALRLVGAALKQAIRAEDVVGRLGGEEFGVLLANTTPADALRTAERLREAVMAIDFRPAGTPHPLSISVGVVIAPDSTSFKQMFRVADQRLYEAKNTGRNRVLSTVLTTANAAAA